MAEAVTGIIQKFQPKFKHRYRIVIDGIPAWTIKATARPTAMINKTTVDYLNIKRHFSTGKLQWSDMPITLMDPINPSASQSVMGWLRMHHEGSTGRAGYASMYKKDITVQVLGPDLVIVQQWDLQGCHIVGNVDFGDMAYDTDEIQEVSFTISIDRAELQY